MDATSFVVTFAGKGWSKKSVEPTDVHKNNPEKELVVQLSGPEFGYVATPICMVQSALVILRETEKLPPGYVIFIFTQLKIKLHTNFYFIRGGVFSPGAAFAKTSLIERLDKGGIKFSVVKSSY